MNFLSNIIEAKKKELEAVAPAGSTWVRRGDLLDRAREEYEDRQQLLEEKSQLKEACRLQEFSTFLSTGKRSREEAQRSEIESRVRRIDPKKLPMSEDAVRKGLRRLGEPCKLFGETNLQTYARLTASTVERAESELLKRPRFDGTPDADYTEPTDERVIRVLSWTDRMAAVWENRLAESKTDTTISILEYERREKILDVARKNLRPMRKRLSEGSLDVDILEALNAIVVSCEAKRFRRANDIYISISIGNAAWPMGVTMVGIHERAGQEKIARSEIAHILDDESTRKYLQCIKRLMSLSEEIATEEGWTPDVEAGIDEEEKIQEKII
ncbi:MAG: uncharacterized protein KVP18_000012 [Porospora cf. gigantea A]|uniref:uncharacterized protein n=1 Tax=Porospora cf. gigantea A TaxID=2853593 RepID=UPI00355A4492|nr:MAG: hypothetical protein KVP18_000012 [Porospora cf. gigantea A]